jgi:uncharacterized membrane protein HdeD (DUF308 family)
MAQNDELKVLKFSLLVSAIIALILGLGCFFVPTMIAKLTGGNTVDLGLLRMLGSLLIAHGIGTFMVYSKPEKQGIFVFTIALSQLLGGLASLYSLIRHENVPATWLIAVIACLLLVLSVLNFWGRSKAKGILSL